MKPAIRILILGTAVAVAFWIARHFLPSAEKGIPEFRPGPEAQALSSWWVVRDADKASTRAWTEGAPKIGLLASTEAGRVRGTARIDNAEFLQFSANASPSTSLAADNGGSTEDILAACVLRTLRPRNAYLMLASDVPVRIYLNSKLIAVRDEERNFRLWDNSYRLTLKRGRNLLVVRISRPKDATAAVALRLEPDAIRAVATALAHDGAIVPQPLITDDSNFSLRLRGVPPMETTKVELRRTDGTVFRILHLAGNRRELFLPAPFGVGPALFCVRIAHEGRITELPLVRGDPETIGKAIRQRLDQHQLSATAAPTLTGLLRRLELLLDPKNYRVKEREWQHKVVFVLHELDAIARETETAAPPSRVGLRLDGFRSGLDNSNQYFRTYFPYNVDHGKRVPLAVILPTPVVANRPFLESVFMSRHLEAEALASMAQRLGVALVWSGYRAAPTGTPADLRHLDEVLREVVARYPVDSQRIYLLGSCAGAVFALQAVNEWPGRFAGIGFLNPTFRNLQLRVSEPELLEVPEYRAWRKANDPINIFLHRRESPPLVFLHDGMAEIGHGERDESESFFAEVRSASLNSVLLLPQARPAIHYHSEGWGRLITELRPAAALPLSIGAKAAGSLGPLWQTVARPFVVVVGTGGTETEQAALAAAAESFRKVWKQAHFVECLVTTDKKLPQDWADSRNLILIGNPATNEVWARLQSSLDVSVGTEQVSAGGITIAGHNLTLQAVVRNQTNPRQEIAVIGAHDPSKLAAGAYDWSASGWYHIAAWEPTPLGPALVAAHNYPP